MHAGATIAVVLADRDDESRRPGGQPAAQTVAAGGPGVGPSVGPADCRSDTASGPARARITASPKVLDARLAQARAEAARLAGEQRTLLTRLRQIEVAIETRELEREKTTRARLASTKAVDAAGARVAAADAELAALKPEVRTRLTRLYRLMRAL